jgi:hypothetical protein
MDPSHTIESLIEYIKSSGGQDLCEKHMMFTFKNETDFYECVHNFPVW